MKRAACMALMAYRKGTSCLCFSKAFKAYWDCFWNLRWSESCLSLLQQVWHNLIAFKFLHAVEEFDALTFLKPRWPAITINITPPSYGNTATFSIKNKFYSKINSKSIYMRTHGHRKLLADRKWSYPKEEQGRYLHWLPSYWLPCEKQPLGITDTLKHTFQWNTACHFLPYLSTCSLLAAAKSPKWDHSGLEDTAK